VFRPTVHEVTVEDRVVWAIAADKTFTVMRQDISVIADPYSAFIADSTHVRRTMRLGYGFTHPASVVKIVATPPGS
jgi:Phage capsid family